MMPGLCERKEGRMNREHAEHILDAYANLHRVCGGEDACVESLREVILDAMTEYKTQTVSTYPNITLPADGKPWVTFTGVDPLYSTCTKVVDE